MIPSLNHLIRYLITFIAVAMIGLCLSSEAATAGPYDRFHTSPGDKVQNQMSVHWGESGTSPDPKFANDEFTIVPINTPGSLRAYWHDPDGKSFMVHPSEVSQGDNSGPFIEAFAPRDRSGTEISLNAPVTLTETDKILAENTVFLVLEDAGLNFDSASRDRIVLTVSDTVTGDTEHLRMQETGPDTGIFVGYFWVTEGNENSRDGIINTLPRSQIEALYSDPWRPSRTLKDTVFVGPMDPSGVLFDSRTGNPVDGVTVTLIDTETNEPAVVYGDDLQATFPATITSGSIIKDSAGAEYLLEPGQYRFPFVAPGSYRLKVEPPTGYVAPSLVEDAELQSLPGSPFSLGPGSRLKAFEVSTTTSMNVDVPIDGEGFITVTRSGSSAELEVGDFIHYRITVGTNLPTDIEGLVQDSLPPGLRILSDTVLVDGTPPLSDPLISETGREITFPDIVFPNKNAAEITYVAQVTPQAHAGDILISRSTANAPRLMANTATHDLSVTPVFGRDKDVLLGQVYGNGCQASYDPDIDLGGIRILLEDGRFAETDSDGRFTIRNLPRGIHVVALDPLSIPRGFEPVLCNNTTQKSGSATSRFVEARGGFSRQVFFHLMPAPLYDHPDTNRPTLKTSSDFDSNWLKSNPHASGLIFPQEGYLPPSKSIDIVIGRKEGLSSVVFLNGSKISNLNRRPSISSLKGNSLDIWKGIPLRDGFNEIRLITTDQQGRVILDQTISTSYNNTVSKMSVVEEQSILTSNGYTRPIVTFRLTNEKDIPLHPGTIVEINAAAPHMFSKQRRGDESKDDIASSSIRGVVDADGLLRLRLAPVQTPGMATFTTSSSGGMIKTQAYIASEGRPFVLVGLASGTASHRTISDNMRAPNEVPLGDVASMDINGRLSLYAQGVVRGKWLLTARYDSGLSDQQADFFDVDPDADYIVYGDASTEGNAASSRDPLYLRIEGNDGEFLYGDFDTNINVGVATYARRLTGARLLFNDDVTSVMTFITDTSQRFVEDSFAADGTSGPFVLSKKDVLTFSERVFVETTSRHDAGEILKREELERGRDYDINYGSQRIFLADPLPSRDSDFNPNAVIVQYEIEAEKSDGIVAGGRISTDISPDLRLGATAIHEDNVAGSDGAGKLVGLDAEWKIDEHLTGSVGLGYSHQSSSNTLPSSTKGHAAEMRLRYSEGRTDIETYLRSQSSDFDIQNQKTDGEHVISAGMNASISLGDTDPGDEGDWKKHKRSLEGVIHAERNQDTGDEAIRTEISHIQKEKATTRSLGLRSEHLTSSGETGSNLKIFGSTDTQTHDGRLRLSIGKEVTLAETGDLSQPDRGILTAEYDATSALTLTAGHEIALDDNLKVSILSFGAAVEAWTGGEINVGATSASGRNGTHTVGHVGFQQEFAYSDLTSFKFGFEKQSPVAGDFEDLGPIQEAGLSNPRLSEGFWAANVGFDHSKDMWKIRGNAEYRTADTGRQHRLKLSAERPIHDDLDFGAQAKVFEKSGTDSDWEKGLEAKASLSWRPFDANFVMLDQLRLKHESNAEGLDQTRLVNSLFYSAQLKEGHEVNLRHGLKFARFGIDDDNYTDILNLVGAEYRHQLNEWSDIGIHGAALQSIKASSTDYSAGLSIGFTPFDNGWLSLGYNWIGFSDDDFSANGETSKGAFVQFRMKFDQKSLEKIINR